MVTTLVLVAAAAAAAGAVAAGAVGAVAAVAAGGAVEGLGVEGLAVEGLAVVDEAVVPLPVVAAIPQATPRSPPTDRSPAAILAWLAGWRRRGGVLSCVAGMSGSFRLWGVLAGPHDRAATSEHSENSHRGSADFPQRPSSLEPFPTSQEPLS